MNYINKFQKDNGLISDGIIGRNTLYKMKSVFNIHRNEHLAHLLGQLHHETIGFTKGEENLNYSFNGLLKVFRKYFDYEKARYYARKPQMIANLVYANRMGNGNECSGDGWLFRGRSAIQITGRYNYTNLANDIDLAILKNPDLLIDKYYWTSAIWYFDKRNIFSYCNEVNNDSIIKVSKIINGGTNGLQDRIKQTKHYYKLLTN